MKNHELFKRDPKTARLVNDGQARIVSNPQSEHALTMLRCELEQFVCEGQYEKGIQCILDSFLTNLKSNNQRAAWISGFYGSGKSHLLKMLCHLWANTPFPDGTKARNLAPDLSDDIRASLTELDQAGRRIGGGVFAASGTMPEGSGSARLTVLGILFRACGLPEDFNQAAFWLFLEKDGYYETFRKLIESAGKNFHEELSNLYLSPLIRKALIECNPNLCKENEIYKLLHDQFPNRKDISTNEFVEMARKVLIRQGSGEIPLSLFVLDEVQHYIGNDRNRSLAITELTELINKQMDSRVLLVAAGQNALSTDTPQFEWLRDRFTLQVELSEADVKTVTRKVLLAKKPEANAAIEKTLRGYSGEIERHLQKTNLSYRSEDRDLLVIDYPILPTRRRFWEEALRSIAPNGSVSQLRNQLRITHEALIEVADKPIGHVIAGDFMFFQQQVALVQQSILPREISDKIGSLDDGTDEGKLRARLCGLVFLIRKLSREKGTDTGLRANEEMLADLLIEDLSPAGIALRDQLRMPLQALVEQKPSILLFDGKEYNLQTREALEWMDHFEREKTKIKEKHVALSERRLRLETAVRDSLKNLKTQHGESRVQRKISFHFGHDEPPKSKGSIPLWIRDGWEIDEKRLLSKAREAGFESPVLFIFLPQISKDFFEENLIVMKAAEAVIEHKGKPSTQEGLEAREAMRTRQTKSEGNVQKIISEVLIAAKVFKGGGTEIEAGLFSDKVHEAAKDSMSRLFPRFDEADHSAWEIVISRVSQGDDASMNLVGWEAATQEHPVCKEILREIGNEKEGYKLRAHFEKPPFGWHRKAIDGALLALCFEERLIAKNADNYKKIALRHLGNNIAKAIFKVESTVITTNEKLALKGLFQKLGVMTELNDASDVYLNKASAFLDRLISLGKDSGGDAPLPDPPDVKDIEDLKMFSGNELLRKILKSKEELDKKANVWMEIAALAKKRLAKWERLQTLLSCAKGLDGKAIEDFAKSSESIRKDRLLLDKTDHCEPLIRETANVLRDALSRFRADFSNAFDNHRAQIEQDEIWKKLNPMQKDSLLKKFLANKEDDDDLPIGSQEELLKALSRTPFSHLQNRKDALPERVKSILKEASRILFPKAKRISLPPETIRNKAEMEAWLAKVRKKIQAELAEGPIIISM